MKLEREAGEHAPARELWIKVNFRTNCVFILYVLNDAERGFRVGI